MAKRNEDVRNKVEGRKRGRPTIENPRTKEFRMRLNEEEYKRLDRISKDFGMNRADTIRKLAEEHEKNMK